jgi:hypothetical protein
MQKTKTKIKNILKLGAISLGIMFVSLSIPLFVNAEAGDPATDPSFQLVSKDCGQTTFVGTDGPVNRATINRECGWGDLLVLLNRIINYVIFLSAFIAVLAFCYAGFLYLTAFGEMGKVEQAHKIFSSTIMGIIIIMIAWLIIASILKVMKVRQEFTILDMQQPINTDGLNNVKDFTPTVPTNAV